LAISVCVLLIKELNSSSPTPNPRVHLSQSITMNS